MRTENGSRIGLLAGGLLLAGLAGLLGMESSQADDKAKVTLEISDWDSVVDKIAAHKGKIVVLDAWSTSCPPCMKEFPNLVKMNARYGGKQVVCMSLSCDYAGIKNKPPEFYRERVMKFLEKEQATFENLMASDEAEIVFDKLKIASIPAVLVYGRDGKLAKCFNNDNATTDEEGFTYADVSRFVEDLLKKK
jgi:thiol-disulfide isomerase/thioredoxin